MNRNGFLSMLAICALFLAFSQKLNAKQAPGANANKIILIPVSDQGRYMVDEVQAKFIQQQLDRAESEGYAAVCLVIDTYGGVLFQAREVTERLLKLKIPSYAFVETKAVSGGTYIAWACSEIAMGEFTTMGDAQVVTHNAEGGMDVAPEKIVSVYRSDWKKLSEARKRSFDLAQAFFDPEIEVLWVGPADARRFMTRTDYDLLPEKERPVIDRIVSRKDQLLTLHAKEAAELGVATEFADLNSYLSSKGYASADRVSVEMTLGQKVLRYLGSNAWVMGVLLLVGLNALYTEIKTPGFGIPGFTAIVCFILFFGSRYLLGTASGLELALFSLGIILCLIEIFVTPGIGVIGGAGVAIMLVSMALSSLPPMKGMPDSPLMSSWVLSVALITLGGFGGGLILLMLSVPLVGKLARPFHSELPFEMRADEGFVFANKNSDEKLVGQIGPANCPLHPVGKMTLSDGRVIDVVSEGEYIESGRKVRIKRIQGNRVIVSEVV